MYVWHSGQGEPLSERAGAALAAFLVSVGPDRLFTYNGGAFDLRRLHRLTGVAALGPLALQHRDLLVAFWCDNRYYASMDSLAVATLGTAASKTNTGAWAATAWATDEASAVLDYCVSDTVVLRRLVEHVRRWGKLQRRAKSGKTMTWTLSGLDGRVPKVEAALAAPASAAWMTDPPARPDVRWAAMCQADCA